MTVLPNRPQILKRSQVDGAVSSDSHPISPLNHNAFLSHLVAYAELAVNPANPEQAGSYHTTALELSQEFETSHDIKI